jgi:hypothetical protein
VNVLCPDCFESPCECAELAEAAQIVAYMERVPESIRGAIEEQYGEEWLLQAAQQQREFKEVQRALLDEGFWFDDEGHVLRGVHSSESCANPKRCVMHSPTDHPMRELPMVWRRQMQRRCEHGELHPDPDALSYRLFRDEADAVRSEALEHGCNCDCCKGAYDEMLANAPKETRSGVKKRMDEDFSRAFKANSDAISRAMQAMDTMNKQRDMLKGWEA